MSLPIGKRVENAMKGAGIKARTFAALVGCHYTTIYDLVKNPEVIPLRVMQERIYDAVEFLEDAILTKQLPLAEENKSAVEKTDQICDMFRAFKQPKAGSTV